MNPVVGTILGLSVISSLRSHQSRGPRFSINSFHPNASVCLVVPPTFQSAPGLLLPRQRRRCLALPCLPGRRDLPHLWSPRPASQKAARSLSFVRVGMHRSLQALLGGVERCRRRWPLAVAEDLRPANLKSCSPPSKPFCTAAPVCSLGGIHSCKESWFASLVTVHCSRS